MSFTRIEAENYDRAFDTTSGNAGTPYPVANPNPGDVDIYATTDTSGYMVGNIRPGEWLEYDISLPQAWSYDVVARVVSTKRSRHSMDLTLGGQAYTFAFSRTGNSWESWADVVIPGVSLNAGSQTMRLTMGSSKFNVNAITFVPSGSPAPTPNPAPAPNPTPSPNAAPNPNPAPSPDPNPTPVPNPAPLPSPEPTPSPNPSASIRVEAENYTEYFDKTTGNAGGFYRTDDVDIYTTTDASGYTVAGVQAGEWIQQSVTIPQDGRYDLVARVASPKSLSHNLTVSLGGQNYQFSFGKTGNSWNTFADITIPDVNLSAGSQNLRMTMGSKKFSLNYVDIVPSGSSAPAPSPNPSPSPSPNPAPTPNPTPSPSFDLGRIMPLGDSLTDGFSTFRGGYRDRLENLLTDNGIGFNFVGGLQNGPGSLSDRDHEGHSGFRIDQISASAPSWLQAQDPDIVLLLIGTNDANTNYQMNTAPDRLSNLIDQILATAPQSHVVVSNLPTTNKNQVNPRIEAYNAEIPGIVNAKVAAGKAVSFVDNSSVVTTADLGDNLHPNQGGYNKMAQVWFDELLNFTTGSAPNAALPNVAPQRTTASIADSSDLISNDGFDSTVIGLGASTTGLGQDENNSSMVPNQTVNPVLAGVEDSGAIAIG